MKEVLVSEAPRCSDCKRPTYAEHKGRCPKFTLAPGRAELYQGYKEVKPNR